jgi:hypothetical protein
MTCATVRHLERLPLGMLYPQQLARVHGLLIRRPLRDQEVACCFDNTSNVAAVDLAEQMGLRPIRITFTAGFEITVPEPQMGLPKEPTRRRRRCGAALR